MSVKAVNTAVIGCGGISRTYIPNLKEFFSIIEVTAVCDAVKECARKRAEEFGIPQVLTMEEVEQSADIELVINLTSPDAHYEVTKRMLLAGKHVFSEKTIAGTVEQGRELMELSHSRGLYLGTAPDTVLGAGIQTARKILDAGLIGRPVSAAACISRSQGLNSELFPFIQHSASGCFPLDVGVYYVAALLCLLGPVKQVTGYALPAPVHNKRLLNITGDKENWTLPGNNLMSGSLLFENGAAGSIHLDGTSINTDYNILTIYGTEGILKLGAADQFSGAVTLITPENGTCNIPFTHGFAEESVRKADPERLGYRGVGAAEMAWAIREQRPARLSAEFGLHTLEVLRGIETSAREERFYHMTSSFEMKPLPSGFFDTIFGGRAIAGAEGSLRDKQA